MNTRRATSPKGGLVFLFTGVFACRSLFAGQIEMDGSIVDTVFNVDGARAADRSFTCSFYLALAHDRWTIKETYGDDAEALGFDGTNTYEQVWFAAQKNDPTNSSCGSIRRGSTCVDGVCPTRLVWIAYCARQFFNENKRGPIMSPYSHPSLLGADSMAYTAEWLDQESGIPKTLKYVFSADLWREELKKKLMDADEPNMFKDGDLSAEYHVVSSTNLGGVTLPLEFDMTRYAFDSR